MTLEELIESLHAGYALDGEFYDSLHVWHADATRVLLDKWHLAGHLAQIPEAGRYFTVEIAGESILVVRTGAATVAAYFNVCRDRGARLCAKGSGALRQIVCPYHRWT